MPLTIDIRIRAVFRPVYRGDRAITLPAPLPLRADLARH